jgi:hypothetical protein
VNATHEEIPPPLPLLALAFAKSQGPRRKLPLRAKGVPRGDLNVAHPGLLFGLVGPGSRWIAGTAEIPREALLAELVAFTEEEDEEEDDNEADGKSKGL